MQLLIIHLSLFKIASCLNMLTHTSIILAAREKEVEAGEVEVPGQAFKNIQGTLKSLVDIIP